MDGDARTDEAITDAEVVDNPSEERYEVHVDRRTAGLAQYHARPGLIALTHTEIDETFEGRGLGSRLIAFALDDARSRELGVLPFCPFVSAYIQRHRDYVDLVPEQYRTEFGL